MKDYILLYGDKKQEDNICIKNMFKENVKINLGWTENDNKKNIKLINEHIKEGVKQLIFLGLEIGWGNLIRDLKKDNNDIIIKVICNTQDSLLYYDYERENFFEMLSLSKENIIQEIAFLRKGQYEVYKQLGYNCSYLMPNYILSQENKKEAKKENNIIDIGIYPLNYTWDKNIFNQLCIAKFIENSNVNYNKLDERMTEFLTTMNIKSTVDKIDNIDEENVIKKVIKNDINIACSFTEYINTIFLISMEQGVPCLMGNTSDFFEEDSELKKHIVTLAEDNCIINSKKAMECIKNKNKIMDLYVKWKEEYNKKAEENKQAFLKK